MNPVVLICTHDRVEITATNIHALLLQSVIPKIVLVCSHRNERDYFLREFPELSIVALRGNNPLGKKFQAGVDLAMGLNPNPLIITGSDDILGTDFIKTACNYITSGVHFIGLKQWFIYHKSKLYLFDYVPDIPLGTRAYSLKMLLTIKGQIFDSGRDRLLDDEGYHKAKKTKLKMMIVKDAIRDGLKVVSVKGEWPMMNSFEAIMKSKNCKLIRTYADTKGIL